MNYSQYSSYLWAFLFTQTFFYLSSRRRPGSNLKIQRWIPACAGMTEGGAGMTEGGAGMTEGGAGMTEGGAGMTEGRHFSTIPQ